MATITELPNEGTIAGFKGTLDYYLWGGAQGRDKYTHPIPCVRRWPRSPGHNRAPAVQAQWSAFIYAAQSWALLSADIKAAYNALATGTAYTGRDMAEMAYLTGIYRYPHT